MSARIAVVDYGVGNVRSVIKALEYLGAKPVFTSNISEINSCSGLVVPGVSSFKACMASLSQHRLDAYLKDAIQSGKKYLGICLGYQILFEESEENPGVPGLGIFKGRVKMFSGKVKIPHMGWNEVRIEKDSMMFAGLKSGSYFYFVHSYFPQPEQTEIIAGTTEYGERFASAIEHGNVWACQFHPEKSSKNGLKILQNFIRWCVS